MTNSRTFENDENPGRHTRAMSAPTPARESSRRMAGNNVEEDEASFISRHSSGHMGNNKTHIVGAQGAPRFVTSPVVRTANTFPEPTLPPVREILNNVDIPRESLPTHENFRRLDGFTNTFTPINENNQGLTHFPPQQARGGAPHEGYGNEELNITRDEVPYQGSAQHPYVSPATYLGEDAHLIARRPSVPMLQMSPPEVREGSFTFQPREHKMTQKILQKTAKCDFCNRRNTSVLLKCQECPTAVCRTCVEGGKLDNGPTHRVTKAERDSLDWDPNTGPRAAGFRSKRRVSHNQSSRASTGDGDGLSWRPNCPGFRAPRSQRPLSVGGDGNQDSDDEDWTPETQSRKKAAPKQAKRTRGRSRKSPLDIDDDDGEEINEASSKRLRRNSGVASVTSGSEKSMRSIALDEEYATAASYRPVRESSLRTLDRAYSGFQPEDSELVEAGTQDRHVEQRPHDSIRPISGQPRRRGIHEVDPEARDSPSTQRDVSRSLPTRPPSARFISTSRAPYHQPSLEQRHNHPAAIPPPSPVHPPVAPRRVAEPGAVPRGTYPRPLYGSTIPGTWQPPLWTSNGVDWERQPKNPNSIMPADHVTKDGTSAAPISAYTSNFSFENGYTLPPIRRGAPSYHGATLPPLTRPGQPPVSQPRLSPLLPLQNAALPRPGYYPSTPVESSRESTFTGHRESMPERAESSAQNDRDVLDAGATLAGMSSSLAPDPEAGHLVGTKEQANKTTQTDDYLMDLDR